VTSATDIHRLIGTDNFFHYSQGLYDIVNQEKIGDVILLRSTIGYPDVIFREAKVVERIYELETKSILKLFKTHFSQEKAPNRWK
jgi:hypothetical protein